ncbi:hypothetical protein CALVIDRAFT_30153 [Calocera viscosa TUFC12733]|uniref:Uncharacterized protein n=1 Tax=Calocera viscosa (strain TUFC12733) TaxID=1330018 RepID=A0A167PCH8_CALVF|nr:hypothetical protein CALVIDRAFT_30153 [Calocera viscosa TUFC12733]
MPTQLFPLPSCRDGGAPRPCLLMPDDCPQGLVIVWLGVRGRATRHHLPLVVFSSLFLCLLAVWPGRTGRVLHTQGCSRPFAALACLSAGKLVWRDWPRLAHLECVSVLPISPFHNKDAPSSTLCGVTHDDAALADNASMSYTCLQGRWGR